MSGAGKSTLSQEVRRRLEGEHSVSDPYEPPESPEVTVYTDAETVERSVERILEALRQRELVTRP